VIKTYLKIGAVMVSLAPVAAMAQSAMPGPAVPGSGYQISEVHAERVPLTSAEASDPSVPGDGYHIQSVKPAASMPLSALVEDPGLPGDGYQMSAPAKTPME